MNETAFDLVHQSVMEHSMTDDERQLERLRITRDKELPEMDFLFQIFGKPCFPRGELVAITGKAKSGKTLFTSMLMAESGGRSLTFLQRIRESPLRVLWYDTEQSEQSTQDILKNRILRMIGPPSTPSTQNCSKPYTLTSKLNYFDVFNVRSLHYEERLRLFEVAVRRFRPDLVLLDGVRDLLADINDGVKAQEVVERLMKLAQETSCCLTCVLHQNKGAEDRNLRGWIGTEIMNKAFEVYACEKVKPENIFVVEQTHTRKYDLGELLFFRMATDTELPVACEAPTRYAVSNGSSRYTAETQAGERLPYMNREWLTFDEHNKPHPRTEELFYEALKTGPLYYSDLQTKVMCLLNCGTPMWNSMFRAMRDKGFIVRAKNQLGNAVWMLQSASAAVPQQTQQQPDEPDLFDAIAAELAAVSGESPSS